MTILRMPIEFPTLQQYWDLLEQHDWMFDFSDEPTEWLRGRAQDTRLQAIAEKGGSDYREMFFAFRKHHFFYGPAAERPPKPERPA